MHYTFIESANWTKNGLYDDLVVLFLYSNKRKISQLKIAVLGVGMGIGEVDHPTALEADHLCPPRQSTRVRKNCNRKTQRQSYTTRCGPPKVGAGWGVGKGDPPPSAAKIRRAPGDNDIWGPRRKEGTIGVGRSGGIRGRDGKFAIKFFF